MNRRLLLAALVLVTAAARAATNDLVVATYNIHHGVPMAGGAIDLPRIAQVIREMDADVVALQEVDRKTRRSGGVDQAEELARLAGMQVAFGPAMAFDGGQYGNAVLCKTALLSVTNHPLPGVRGAEPRAVLEVTFQPSDAAPRIRLLAAHLDNENDAGRLLQAKRLNELAAAAPAGVVLLAGDFNAVPGSGPVRTLLESWTNVATVEEPTYPADRPADRIDHILQRTGGGLVCRTSRVVAEPGASDHRPLLTILAAPGH
ncbi:MAG: endonuclease/exonuclease/phosphatase family protein [Kiritimatiellia bacterium]